MNFRAENEGEVTSRINVKIRGSKAKMIECKAMVIKPQLSFEKLIDFDYMIVKGHPGVKKFVLINPT